MKSYLKILWKQEKHDLKLLFLLLFSVPLCWIIFLKWNLNFSISSNDATKILFPFYPDLTEKSGDWHSILYRPEILGGFIILGYFGSYPVTRILASMGLNALTCLNLTFLTIQILFGFYCIQIALNFKQLWSTDSEKPRLNQIFSILGFGLLNTFLPVLAWRISYGHPNIISGSLIFLSFFLLILVQQRGKVSLTLLCITTISLVHAFEYQSHQMTLYSIVFGAPIWIGLSWPKQNQSFRESFRLFLLPVALAFGCFAYSIELFWPFFKHAISTDTARSILGENITYSYLTASISDWLTSLPWSAEWINNERLNPFFFHEINYPVGPIVLLLALVPWKKKSENTLFPLGLGLWISFFMALVFSMDLEPFSSLLSTIAPPLKFFRVPNRSILPVLFMIPVLGSAALFSAPDPKRIQTQSILFLALGGIILNFQSDIREIFLWIICIFAIYQNKIKSPQISNGALLLILGFGSLLGFKERMLPLWSSENLEQSPQLISQELYRQAPALKSSLTRVILDFEPEPYSLNRGYPLGVSTLSGYFSPPTRFLKLYYTLANARPEIMNQTFLFDESFPNYTPLRELYNVAYQAKLLNGRYQVTQLDLNPTEAWFSQEFSFFPEWIDLAQALNHQGTQLRNYLRHSVALLSYDSKVQEAQLPPSISSLCSSAKVLSVSAPQHSQQIDLQVESPETCPLTLSMNYVEILEATGQLTGSHEPEGVQKLKVFPAYGALTGILVPKGIYRIHVEPVIHTPRWVKLTQILGAGFLLFLIGWQTLTNLKRGTRTTSLDAQ